MNFTYQQLCAMNGVEATDYVGDDNFTDYHRQKNSEYWISKMKNIRMSDHMILNGVVPTFRWFDKGHKYYIINNVMYPDSQEAMADMKHCTTKDFAEHHLPTNFEWYLVSRMHNLPRSS